MNSTHENRVIKCMALWMSNCCDMKTGIQTLNKAMNMFNCQLLQIQLKVKRQHLHLSVYEFRKIKTVGSHMSRCVCFC